jgi:hypothetical protein
METYISWPSKLFRLYLRYMCAIFSSLPGAILVAYVKIHNGPSYLATIGLLAACVLTLIGWSASGRWLYKLSPTEISNLGLEPYLYNTIPVLAPRFVVVTVVAASLVGAYAISPKHASMINEIPLCVQGSFLIQG